MRKIIVIQALLFLCAAAFCQEVVSTGSTTASTGSTGTESSDTAEQLSFTDEPMEEEVAPDDALIDLLKTAVIPEIHPLDTIEETPPSHIAISFVSDEALAKPQVEAFRKMYLSPKWSALLRTYLESAMEYRLYVRKAVQDAKMPEMLEYLPVVESNYKTNAKSRSGAIGMWQFMANSVWPFLTLNDFVDERLDPWKSTEAALKKLTDNYNIFNDWLLAIGAYNCGVGAMNRAIKRAGGVKDFWYLAEGGFLSKQTAEYVPKLIAIADLAINSQYYGIDIPSHDEEFELLENEKIIRHKGKIESAIKNAEIFKEIQKEYGSFSNYIWGFTGGEIIKAEYKTTSELSETISKDLKKRGMKFVGPTIIYSYLESIGVINNHQEGCFRY